MAVNVSVPRTAAENEGYEQPDPRTRRLFAAAVILGGLAAAALSVIHSAGWATTAVCFGAALGAQYLHIRGRQADARNIAELVRAIRGGAAP